MSQEMIPPGEGVWGTPRRFVVGIAKLVGMLIASLVGYVLIHDAVIACKTNFFGLESVELVSVHFETLPSREGWTTRADFDGDGHEDRIEFTWDRREPLVFGATSRGWIDLTSGKSGNKLFSVRTVLPSIGSTFIPDQTGDGLVEFRVPFRPGEWHTYSWVAGER
jgi:hypothetical protein